MLNSWLLVENLKKTKKSFNSSVALLIFVQKNPSVKKVFRCKCLSSEDALEKKIEHVF